MGWPQASLFNWPAVRFRLPLVFRKTRRAAAQMAIAAAPNATVLCSIREERHHPRDHCPTLDSPGGSSGRLSKPWRWYWELANVKSRKTC